MVFKKKNIYLFIVIIILFFYLNFTLFSFSYHHYDVEKQQKEGNEALIHNIPYLYGPSITNPNLPPLYMYILKFNAYIHLLLFKNNNIGSTSYVFISKIIPTICNLLIGIIIYLIVKKKSEKLAFMVMLLYLFNPGVIYNTAIWGQFDSVYTLFLLMSIIFLKKNKLFLSVLFFTLALLTKLQSIVLIPIFIYFFIKKVSFRDWIYSFFISMMTIFVVILPFIFYGGLISLFNIIHMSFDKYPYATLNAFNIWYIIFPQNPHDWSSYMLDTIGYGIFNLKLIGFLLMVFYVFLMLFYLFRGANVYLVSACLFLAFFILPTRIHERYLFPFFAIFSLIYFIDKRFMIIYLSLTFTYLLNLMIVMPVYPFQSFFYNPINSILIGVFLSSINVLILFFLTRLSISDKLKIDNKPYHKDNLR